MTAIAITDIAGPYKPEGTTPQLTTSAFVACAVAGNTVPVDKPILLILRNTDNSNPYTVTFPSSQDPYGRTAPITTFSIAANGIVMRKFAPEGWENAVGSGLMDFTVENVAIEAMAVYL